MKNKYSVEELHFILFNNRSLEGVLLNFVDWTEYSPELIEIEKQFSFIKSQFDEHKTIEVNSDELNLQAEDINYSIQDLQKYTELVEESHQHLLSKNFEYQWLIDRGINENLIKKYKLSSLSHIKDEDALIKIGATCHPLLKPILDDGLEGGGIVIPLYENGILKNITTRKISDIGKLKYTQSCPELDVYNSDKINKGDEIWITEGIFDMYALSEQDLKSVSVSSAMWSGLQLYKLLLLEPSKINIFCDDDKVGLKTGRMLQKFFLMRSIPSMTYISSECKDASEHFFQEKLEFDKVNEIDITKEMIDDKEDQSFNFTNYIKNRKF